MSDFENAGIILMAASKRSLKIELDDRSKVFSETYYVSIKDIEEVLKGRKETATMVKLISQENEA